jgi:hypothetical protein
MDNDRPIWLPQSKLPFVHRIFVFNITLTPACNQPEIKSSYKRFERIGAVVATCKIESSSYIHATLG